MPEIVERNGDVRVVYVDPSFHAAEIEKVKEKLARKDERSPSSYLCFSRAQSQYFVDGPTNGLFVTMKLLTFSTFLGAIALVKADYPAFHFLNRTIPDNVPVGTEIDLEWTSQQYTGPFPLSLYAFNTTPYGYHDVGPWGSIPLYESKEVNLTQIPSAASGTYIWIAEPIDEAGVWTGPEFLYEINAIFPDGSVGGAGAFHLI
ncbi:hypothetical protein NPX13_g6624 [Xylaria arbuscula]|uniref:Uncharacterized protein n=1 Tax=Xylaria arbuscula TaxID=114810 RepID=A0A9W8NBI0_9PEZI|nr:hypothetical protein NPX13_g6624 [Xylaria arbuscula]